MQINSVSMIADATQRHAAAHTAPLPAPAPEPTKAVPHGLVPAPGLRPNVQDYVDINRTLLALRKL